MATRVRVTLNRPGINAMMKSDWIKGILDSYGAEVANRANVMAGEPGARYGSSTHQASYVAIANIYPENAEAGNDVYRNNTLLKAVKG